MSKEMLGRRIARDEGELSRRWNAGTPRPAGRKHGHRPGVAPRPWSAVHEPRFLGRGDLPNHRLHPGFIMAPEGKGVAEWIICTLEEQLLWVQNLDTVAELKQTLLEQPILNRAFRVKLWWRIKAATRFNSALSIPSSRGSTKLYNWWVSS